MIKRFVFAYQVLIVVFCCSCAAPAIQTDVLVVGGSASGVTAGIQSARLGMKTMIIEEHQWLGGMLTSAGVGAVDGNFRMPAGLFGEFRDSLVNHYGSLGALQTGWVSKVLFEPSVGNRIWKNMAAGESDLTVVYETKFVSAEKLDKGWRVVTTDGKKQQVVETQILIDATELGDVAKACGVGYDLGIEGREVSGEAEAADKNYDIVQDLTYAMIIKDYGQDADMTIECPENYDPSLFYCSCLSPKCTDPNLKPWDFDMVMKYGKLQNNKYMINWPMKGNDYYTNIVEMTPDEREAELKKAKHRSLCYLYYMQHELGYKNLGLADDEFPTEDKLPFIPYHRESRRIHGLVRYNLNHITKPYDFTLYRTGIAVGDYPVDHHHGGYPEPEKFPVIHLGSIPSFNVPLGVMIPQEVKDLIVAEKSPSVSNLVNGCTRLQPVVCQLGQVAGILAAMAVKEQKELSEVTVRDVQRVFLDARGYVMPYLDLPVDDVHFKALQRIGATGILRGVGRSIDWSNETWFQVDSVVDVNELKLGLAELYPDFQIGEAGNSLSVGNAVVLVAELSQSLAKNVVEKNSIESAWEGLGLSDYDPSRLITRKEFAVVFDRFIDPFNTLGVDINGAIIH